MQASSPSPQAAATVEVVGAILRRDGARGPELFAARRSLGRSSGGLWEFPGGKVEPGETPQQALVREVREELGVTIKVGALVDRARVPVGDAVIDLACYDAVLTGPGPTASTDHDELRWVPVGRLGELQWAPGDVPIIERMPRHAV